MILERALAVLVLVIAVLAIAAFARRRVRRKVGTLLGSAVPEALRPSFAGRAGIIYFYGPHCGACRQQAAALDDLVRAEPLALVKIDAAADPETAGALGIATVPATVVVAPGGRVQEINLGLRSRAALQAQLHSSPAQPGPASRADAETRALSSSLPGR